MQLSQERSTRSSVCRVCVALMLLCAAPTGNLSAQRLPLVMQHGIRSTASTWDMFADSLTAAYPITAVRRSTTATQSQVYQASELQSTILQGLPDSSAGIAHSNGGLVLRQVAMNGGHFSSLLTIGTLHSGAPTAQAVLNLSMPGIVLPIADDLALFNSYYQGYTFTSDDYFNTSLMNYTVATAVQGLFNLLASTLGFDSLDPLWQTMYPSSPYIMAINSLDSLQVLAQRVPSRAYVRTKISNPDLAIYRLVETEAGAANLDASFGYLEYALLEKGYQMQYDYCGYNSQDYNKCVASQFMIYTAMDVSTMGGRYCTRMMYENISVNNAVPAFCGESDAVVPYERQVFPTTPNYSAPIEYPVVGVSHTEQTKSPAVLQQVQLWLGNAGVKRCGAGPAVTLTIGSAPSGFYVGQTKPLSVTRLDACSQATTADALSATSSNASIVSTSISNGIVYVNAIGVGSATITVHAGALSSSRAITVIHQPVY